MKCVRKSKIKGKTIRLAVAGLLTIICLRLYAQSGNEGIDQATEMVKGYFDSGANLMYAISAVGGLIGAVKVFNKWNHGDHDTGKFASAWFGSCVFIVIVATVLKSFFGI